MPSAQKDRNLVLADLLLQLAGRWALVGLRYWLRAMVAGVALQQVSSVQLPV